jgi:hypothetical protein
MAFLSDIAPSVSRGTRTMLAPSIANGLITLSRSSRDTPRRFVPGKRPATGASPSSPRTRTWGQLRPDSNRRYGRYAPKWLQIVSKMVPFGTVSFMR